MLWISSHGRRDTSTSFVRRHTVSTKRENGVDEIGMTVSGLRH